MRRIVAAACATTAVALVLAQGSSAAVLRAETVLPPGESGFVSIAGVGSGSGSPHLYDQQQPFIEFRRKNAQLGQSGGQPESPLAGVRIVRDGYGVPAIYAGNDGDAWYGAGYATAEDRLFELELFRRATTGRLAEILGRSYLASDIATRRDFYTTPELAGMMGALPAPLQQRYRRYLDGINAYAARVQSDPSLQPAEFAATGASVQPFALTDLIAIGVYLARTTPNTDGSELANARALDQLGPASFNRVLPLRIPGQVSTIPRSAGLFPSVPGRTRREERRALTRSSGFVRGLRLPTSDQPSGSSNPGSSALPGPLGSLLPPLPIHTGGSSMVAVRDRRNHRAYLFSGPELGFSAPEELYELEVHAPGLDVRGITAPGAPVVAIGHNAHVAWGMTSGLSQTNSLYAEQLAGDAERYSFRGRSEAMSCRDETFSWRSPPTDLLSAKLPGAGQEVDRLCRTRHGPVQARAGATAYARRYATWGREAQTLVGLADLDRAGDIRAVNRAAGELTWNENLMAADDHGNIGYWHPGLIPVEPKRWDERLPFPGTGDAEWQRLLPVRQRPHVINPRRGWLSNWNNIPSQGWTTGNDPASERVVGAYHRDAFLERLVKQLMAHRPSFAHLQQLVAREGTTAQQRPLAASRLARAARGASGPAATVLRTILAWDGSYGRTDAGGTVDPGVAAWQAFKSQAQQLALARLGPGAQPVAAAGTSKEHVFDASLGQAFALRTLSIADLHRAAADAFGQLASTYGSSDPARWRAKRQMFDESALGAEQPPPLPFFDRGTWEQLAAVGPAHPPHRPHRRRRRR